MDKTNQSKERNKKIGRKHIANLFGNKSYDKSKTFVKHNSSSKVNVIE